MPISKQTLPLDLNLSEIRTILAALDIAEVATRFAGEMKSSRQEALDRLKGRLFCHETDIEIVEAKIWRDSMTDEEYEAKKKKAIDNMLDPTPLMSMFTGK